MHRIRPDFRRTENFEMRSGGRLYLATIHFLPDGLTPIEIALAPARIDSPLGIMARETALVVSLALQYGAPLAELRDAATRDAWGEPATAIGALLDVIASRWPSVAAEPRAADEGELRAADEGERDAPASPSPAMPSPRARPTPGSSDAAIASGKSFSSLRFSDDPETLFSMLPRLETG